MRTKSKHCSSDQNVDKKKLVKSAAAVGILSNTLLQELLFVSNVWILYQ